MSNGFDTAWLNKRKAKQEAVTEGNRAALRQGPPKPRKMVEKRKPKKHVESDMQKTCVRWFRMVPTYKRYLLLSFPNGANLAGDKKQQVIQRGIMKAEGMMKGASDLILITDDGVLFLEAKTAEGRQSDDQRLFQAMVEAMGYNYLIFRSFDEFREIVESLIGKA